MNSSLMQRAIEATELQKIANSGAWIDQTILASRKLNQAGDSSTPSASTSLYPDYEAMKFPPAAGEKLDECDECNRLYPEYYFVESARPLCFECEAESDPDGISRKWRSAIRYDHRERGHHSIPEDGAFDKPRNYAVPDDNPRRKNFTASTGLRFTERISSGDWRDKRLACENQCCPRCGAKGIFTEEKGACGCGFSYEETQSVRAGGCVTSNIESDRRRNRGRGRACLTQLRLPPGDILEDDLPDGRSKTHRKEIRRIFNKDTAELKWEIDYWKATGLVAYRAQAIQMELRKWKRPKLATSSQLEKSKATKQQIANIKQILSGRKQRAELKRILIARKVARFSDLHSSDAKWIIDLIKHFDPASDRRRRGRLEAKRLSRFPGLKTDPNRACDMCSSHAIASERFCASHRAAMLMQVQDKFGKKIR